MIRITTDEGITGWNQIETPKPYLQPVVLQLKSLLVGQDPVHVERVMRRIRWRGGMKPWGAAVSAVEMALWDIAGKAANLPVHRLLGGKVRDQVRTYRTLYHEPGVKHVPADYVRWAEIGKALPEGFTMFKLPTSFHSSMVREVPNYFYGDVQPDAGYPYPHKGTLTHSGFNRMVECVTAARETLGEDYGMAVDAGPGFLPRDALRFAKAVEKLHLLWIEDMITGDYSPYVNADVYRDVTHQTTTPIHTGEEIYLRQNFKTLIESHRLRLVAKELGVQKLDASEVAVQIAFIKNPPIDPMKIIQLIQSKKNYKLAGQDKLRVETHIEEVGLRLVRVKELLKELS